VYELTYTLEDFLIASVYFERLTRYLVLFCPLLFLGVVTSSTFPRTISLIGHFTTYPLVGLLSHILYCHYRLSVAYPRDRKLACSFLLPHLISRCAQVDNGRQVFGQFKLRTKEILVEIRRADSRHAHTMIFGNLSGRNGRHYMNKVLYNLHVCASSSAVQIGRCTNKLFLIIYPSVRFNQSYEAAETNH